MEMIMVDDVMVGDMSMMGDMGEWNGTMTGTEQVSKVDELMSSWVFVGGVTAGVLAIGILLGLLSAKRKIKKGIDLYED
ncbi:MAG: hypothetical protein J6J38_00130 [Lachnospiraceae bacterium]|nr:hypothetical protein [Lachnospiraceae bacterium]